MSAALSVRKVSKAYRGVAALDAVSLDVAPGSITGLIGPNGSGKSTLFDCITGFQPPDAGEVRLAGRDIGGLAPQRIARLGLRRTFQQLRVFPELTVRENLLTAAQSAPGHSLAAELLRTSAVRAHERAMRSRAQALLEEIALAPLAERPAGGLSYGQKKLVELGMALMNEPSVLLLDEPMAGVNPTLIEGLKAELLRVNRRGIALLLVEHNLKLVFEICTHVVVLDQGRVLAAGAPAEIAADPRVIDAYLGGQAPAGTERID